MRRLVRNETFLSPNAASYKYKLYSQEDGTYVLYLEDEKDATRRFVSEPFELTPGVKPKTEQEPVKLNALAPGEQVKGKPMEMVQINRGKLLVPMRARQFALPDETLVAMAGLTNFAARERLWTPNPDGSFTSKKDGTVIRPDFKLGFFVNDKGEKVGVGFRTFSGFDNYIRIITDPRIQGPFFRIFLWTVAFSAISVFLTFARRHAAVRHPRTKGSAFSANLPHALYPPLRGSGPAINPDSERDCSIRSLARSTPC